MNLQAINRRNVLSGGVAFATAPWLSMMFTGCDSNEGSGMDSADGNKNSIAPDLMKIHYLEIVTPEAEATVALYTKIHGLTFAAADEMLGGARTAELSNGGLLSIRAPMRDTETPVVRPYFLVDDIEVAVSKAKESGAEIAMMPMEIPGRGRFAIFIQGGIETGLWEV